MRSVPEKQEQDNDFSSWSEKKSRLHILEIKYAPGGSVFVGETFHFTLCEQKGPSWSPQPEMEAERRALKSSRKQEVSANSLIPLTVTSKLRVRSRTPSTESLMKFKSRQSVTRE